jgi:hypothetical protein
MGLQTSLAVGASLWINVKTIPSINTYPTFQPKVIYPVQSSHPLSVSPLSAIEQPTEESAIAILATTTTTTTPTIPTHIILKHMKQLIAAPPTLTVAFAYSPIL